MLAVKADEMATPPESVVSVSVVVPLAKVLDAPVFGALKVPWLLAPGYRRLG